MYSSQTDNLAPSPNYEWKRRGNHVEYLVIHTTEGSGVGSVAWLQNPNSGVSAHYVVMEDGEIVGMVDEDHTAWHAGRIIGVPTTPLYDGTNPNFVSVGIEIAGYAAAPMGPQQMASTVALIKEIRMRRGLVPIVGHFELSPGDRSDPGQYNWNWLNAELEEEDMTPDQVKAEIRNMLMSPEGANLVEFAISRDGGFGGKLADAMGRRVAEAVRDAMKEALVS